MHAIALPRLKFDRAALPRGITAGATWGAVVSAALLGLSLYQCGTVCLGQIVDMTALSVAAGIVTIGPLVLLWRTAQTPAQ